MTDQDVRDFLERMAAEEPVPFLDPEPLARRARRRAARTIVGGAIGVAVAIAVLFAGVAEIRTAPAPIPADTPEQPSVDLGIFAPVAGRIVYCDNPDLWSVDPSAPSPISTLERVGYHLCAPNTVPLGWSSDGIELLFVREEPTDDTFPYDRHLFILHADGTVTQVTPEPVGGAAISLDGSRVVFAGDGDDDGLYVVDAEGGQPVRIANGEEPTISPDGTQIAYLGLPRSGCCVPTGREHVWVVNADGTDAHEILADEPALAKGADSLTWSPAGDRIAMDGYHEHESQEAIYTFAPDGSEFTMVIPNGANPYWSPDGSQIAYVVLGGSPNFSIADADGSNVRTFGFGNSGPWHPGTAETTDNGQPSVVTYSFFHGKVTFAAADPWKAFGGLNDWGALSMGDFWTSEEGIELVACEPGPASENAQALARSIRSDPDHMATAPEDVRVGGVEGLVMDVTIAAEMSVCGASFPSAEVVTGPTLDEGIRMRLYLLDLPAGSATRNLVIAIAAPEARFDAVIEAAAPIIESIEFHAP
jgi:hypothetical protein